MQIEIQRIMEFSNCIVGNMLLDGNIEYATIELPKLFNGQENVEDHTCIPADTYDVECSFSPNLHYHCPEIMNVPGRTHIRIHIANFSKDILGCIGVGMSIEREKNGQGWISRSRVAFNSLMERLNALPDGEKITLKIIDIPREEK